MKEIFNIDDPKQNLKNVLTLILEIEKKEIQIIENLGIATATQEGVELILEELKEADCLPERYVEALKAGLEAIAENPEMSKFMWEISRKFKEALS